MDQIEEWKDIIGYPGYKISNQGNVSSTKKCMGDSGWITTNEVQRILKPRQCGSYYCVALRAENNTSYHRVHQLVMDTFKGNQPVDTIIHHIDNDSYNNRLINLEYITPSENSKRAWKYTHNHNGRRTRTKKRRLPIILVEPEEYMEIQNIANIHSSGNVEALIHEAVKHYLRGLGYKIEGA